MTNLPETQGRHLLITKGAYDKESHLIDTPEQLMQLARCDYFQHILMQYRRGNAAMKQHLLAVIPQGCRRNPEVTSHTMQDLVPSGILFLDDDRPHTEITAEERHRLVEERLAQLGLSDMPHVAMRSASMKYHLLVPARVDNCQQATANGQLPTVNFPLNPNQPEGNNGQLKACWEHWRDLFEGVLVPDPSTVNVNRLMFFTGELLTPPESLEWLFEETDTIDSGQMPTVNSPFNPTRPEANNRQLPTFNGQLTDVASRLVINLCGTTTPPEGMRNNTLYEAARQLAYIEDTEEGMLKAFAPLGYLGLPLQEARQCIRSAMRHEKTWKYTLPPELGKAMEEKQSPNPTPSLYGGALQTSQTTIEPNSLVPSPPLWGDAQRAEGVILPELISLFTDHVPENARMAVASMAFAPLGAYLNNSVTIRDVSNKSRNIQFTSIVVGNSSSGKGFVDFVSEFITRRLCQRDAASWAALDAWQEQKRSIPKGDPQPLKPIVPLRLLSSNMTEPALLERLKALEATAARAYIKASEIDELRKFQATGSRLGGGQDIILSAFDTAAYGALRVSAEAVSTMTTMSVNICASSTYPGTQEFFRAGVERGSVGRCDFSIVNDSYEVPLYKDFTPEAADRLDQYLDRLENATGEIVSPDIDRLIEDIRLSYHDPASPLSWQANAEYFKLCHRQLLITKQKATILYICNDYQWDPTWEPWLTESFYYGMQCKVSVFANEIASWAKRQNTCVTHIAVHGPKSELVNLPETFTLADLVTYKRSKSTTPVTDEELAEKAKAQIRTWLHRGRIIPASEPGTWTKA